MFFRRAQASSQAERETENPVLFERGILQLYSCVVSVSLLNNNRTILFMCIHVLISTATPCTNCCADHNKELNTVRSSATVLGRTSNYKSMTAEDFFTKNRVQ